MFTLIKAVRVRTAEDGFTLLEVLIALVVLSVGFLGMGALQLSGLRGSQGAYLRGQGTVVANQLAERMHANSSGAVSEYYDLSKRTDAPIDSSGIDCEVDLETLGESTFPEKLCSDEVNSDGDPITGVSCTNEEMAQFDFFQVYCAAKKSDLLPELNVTVACNPVIGACALNSSAHAITVSWRKGKWDKGGTGPGCPTGQDCVVFELVP